jgi:hypothetical protein
MFRSGKPSLHLAHYRCKTVGECSLDGSGRFVMVTHS